MTNLKNPTKLTLQFFFIALFGFVLAACQHKDDETNTKQQPRVSAISINYIATTDSWWLHFDSAEPILCAINLTEINNTAFDTLQAMDMTSPATEHDIQLNVIAGQNYRVQITTFNTAHVVQRSTEFTFSTDRIESNNLIKDDAPTFTTITDFSLASDIWTLAPQASNITSNSATIDFTSSTPTLASTAYGTTPAYGLSIRIAGGNASLAHNLQLLALDDDASYHYNVILIDNAGTLYKSQSLSFTTAKDNNPNSTPAEGENVALLSLGATISNVSSIYSNSFSADKAIDGNKDTQWSSQGDGNNAFIEINLDKVHRITGIGFWTRTMTINSEISQFEVLTTDGSSLGVFDLPDATQLYVFDIPDTNQQTLKFKVIQSSGFNTGARTIAIYSNN